MSWALALTASAAAWTAPAQAATAPTPAYPVFPASSDLPTVAAWLRAQTSVDLGAVVGVGEDSVFVLEPTRDPVAPPTIRATVRQEVINAEFAAALGGRSAVMVGDIDCEGRRVFQRELDLYAGNNKQGAMRRLGGASDWQAVPPGTFMDNVVAAVCEPDYTPIFPGGQIAEAEPPAQVALLGRPTERSPATSLGPVLQPRAGIPMIAPVAPAPVPNPPAPAPTPRPPAVVAPAPPLPGAPRPLQAAAVAAPIDPDGPIATQPTARPLLIAPPAAPSPPRVVPAVPPAPVVVAAAPPPAPAPVPPPPRPVAPPPPAARPTPAPAPAPARAAITPVPRPPTPAPSPAPTAGALGLRPLALGRAEIGAFGSAEAAIAAWRALAAAHPQAMAGRRQRIELSTASGATRFRAFVDGFAGRSEAEAFCRAVRAQGGACIASE